MNSNFSLVASLLTNVLLDARISYLIEGLDLNPLFTGAASFRPAGDGGALKLFSNAGIVLCHGWLVDPHSPEYDAVSKVEDYDNAVNAVVNADVIAKGQLVVQDGDFSSPGPSGSSSSAGPSAGPSSSKGKAIDGADSIVISGGEALNNEDRKKVQDGKLSHIYLVLSDPIQFFDRSPRYSLLPGKHIFSVNLLWPLLPCIVIATRFARSVIPQLPPFCTL